MGNNGDANIPATEVAQSDFNLHLHQDYWHTDTDGNLHVITDYNNRYDVTHNGVGLPDLNTSNTELQGIINDYLTTMFN